MYIYIYIYINMNTYIRIHIYIYIYIYIYNIYMCIIYRRWRCCSSCHTPSLFGLNKLCLYVVQTFAHSIVPIRFCRHFPKQHGER
jgi:hypothetical protein